MGQVGQASPSDCASRPATWMLHRLVGHFFTKQQPTWRDTYARSGGGGCSAQRVSPDVSARTKKAPGPVPWGAGASSALPTINHQQPRSGPRGNGRWQEEEGRGERCRRGRAARGELHVRHHRRRRRPARRGVSPPAPALAADGAGRRRGGGTAPRAGGAGDRHRRPRGLARRAPRVGEARVLQPPPGRAAVRRAAEPGVGEEGGRGEPGDGQGGGEALGGVGGQGHGGGPGEDHGEGQEEGLALALAVGAAP